MNLVVLLQSMSFVRTTLGGFEQEMFVGVAHISLPKSHVLCVPNVSDQWLRKKKKFTYLTHRTTFVNLLLHEPIYGSKCP